MKHSNFFMKDYKAQQKCIKSTNRILLKSVVFVKRKKRILYNKNNYKYSELDFL